MRNALICAALAACACAPAWAINKCTGPDGRVSFQDAPCAGRGQVLDVGQSSGRAPMAATAAAPVAPATASESVPPAGASTEVQRIEAQIAKSQRERRRRTLEREIPAAEDALQRHAVQCELKLDELRERKRAANNNLAGATWQSSLSSEMTAVATRCDTENRTRRAELSDMRRECRELGGCAR